jgi:hypothetical protein
VGEFTDNDNYISAGIHGHFMPMPGILAFASSFDVTPSKILNYFQQILLQILSRNIINSWCLSCCQAAFGRTFFETIRERESKFHTNVTQIKPPVNIFKINEICPKEKSFNTHYFKYFSK